MTEYAKFVISQISLLTIGMIFSFILPLVLAIIWIKKKNEDLMTVLIGAAAFFIFVVILGGSIRNIVVSPLEIGLPDHAVSRFLNERDVLKISVLAVILGVSGETGRLVAFKTVLKNKKNRETSISYGIGHAGFEVMFVLGVSFIMSILNIVMYNTGMLSNLVNQMMAQTPGNSEYGFANQFSGLSVADIVSIFVDRVFSVIFNIGASILVFYACRDKKKFWLYPMAILLHTAMTVITGLSLLFEADMLEWIVSGVGWSLGLLTFCGAYFLFYKKDPDED